MFRRNVRTLRLTERQWRIYLAVWLVALAAVTGVVAGIIVPKLLERPAPLTLVGDIVLSPPVAAPGFNLQDQNGASVSLSQLKGRVVALTFLDTQCLSLCRLQASLIGSVQADLGSSVPLTLVVVSVRPEVDTPAAINTFAQAHGLKQPYAWLNGSKATLTGVWGDYGITVQPGAGDLAHSSVIYLLDKRGNERVEFADVPDPTWMENDIKLLAQS
jgi:cytochrome oxidase Cu insertion factor (SCO1/SenC/PrrC family)